MIESKQQIQSLEQKLVIIQNEANEERKEKEKQIKLRAGKKKTVTNFLIPRIGKETFGIGVLFYATWRTNKTIRFWNSCVQTYSKEVMRICHNCFI